VLAAARQVAAQRRAIVRRRDALAAMLGGISAEPTEARLPDQQLVMGCAAVERRAMEAMEAELSRLEARRQELLVRLRDIRARRETLEKLRHEALAQYLRQEAAAEQKQHDETSRIAFVRNTARERADCRSITA
jgi:predicted  nucleic acid-binding Zn-ribbon protein